MQIITDIIQQYGYAGIFALTTLEQFIFPVPADVFITMGTTAGLSYKKIMLIVLIAALIGSYVGYFLGKYLGHPVMLWLFGKTRLEKGEKFIQKYGVWGVILAGLTPIPFKIVTWTAGIFEMPLGKYTLGIILGRMPRYLITGYLSVLIYKTKFYATPEMSAIILGTLQGITEFLPISSSGHLAITEHFLNLGSVDLEIFDIFLHGGSLLAILIFFWRDWLNVLKELWVMIRLFRFDKNTLTAKLIVGTIPAIFAGLLFGGFISDNLRKLSSVAIFFIVIAMFFLFAEWKSKGSADKEKINLKRSLIIGAAQALALIPGVSRAGTTIATGMLFGLKREAAAKFSFMLGGIAILAANVYALISINGGDVVLPSLTFTLIGTAASFAVSLCSIAWLLKFLKKHTLRPFAFYLMLAGALILMVF